MNFKKDKFHQHKLFFFFWKPFSPVFPSYEQITPKMLQTHIYINKKNSLWSIEKFLNDKVFLLCMGGWGRMAHGSKMSETGVGVIDSVIFTATPSISRIPRWLRYWLINDKYMYLHLSVQAKKLSFHI